MHRNKSCPLYPRKRTYVRAISRSAMGRQATSHSTASRRLASFAVQRPQFGVGRTLHATP
jgi:hypothetical protein